MKKSLRMMELSELVTDKQIENVFHNTNFGKGSNPRDIVKHALLKENASWANGHTATCILRELGLITKSGVTTKGKLYLYEAFKGDSTI